MDAEKVWPNWSLDGLQCSRRSSPFYETVGTPAGGGADRLEAAILGTPVWLRERQLGGLFPAPVCRTPTRSRPISRPPAWTRSTKSPCRRRFLAGWMSRRARGGRFYLLQPGDGARGDHHHQPEPVGRQHRRRRLLQGLAVVARREERSAGPQRPPPHHPALRGLRVCAAALRAAPGPAAG